MIQELRREDKHNCEAELAQPWHASQAQCTNVWRETGPTYPPFVSLGTRDSSYQQRTPHSVFVGVMRSPHKATDRLPSRWLNRLELRTPTVWINIPVCSQFIDWSGAFISNGVWMFSLTVSCFPQSWSERRQIDCANSLCHSYDTTTTAIGVWYICRSTSRYTIHRSS